MIDRAIVVVKDTTSTGFSDNDATLARPDSFWQGATFQVRTGSSAGTGGTISGSLAAGSDGLPWFTTSGPAPVLAAGDVVAVTRTQTAGTPYNWFWPTSSNGYIAIDTSEARPGSPGHSVAELTLQQNQKTVLYTYWDTTPNQIPGGKFLPVNGNWELSFWARTSTGSATVNATFTRQGASPFVSKTWTLAPSWQRFVMDFSAVDNQAANPLVLSFVASGTAGDALHLDDVALGRVSDLANGWRAEVAQTLQALHPGYLRDLQLQFGDTMTNRLAPAFGRSPQRWQPDPNNTHAYFEYGLPDFLSLCQQVGAQPWIVLPSTLYDEEFTQFGNYLATQQSSYGFKEVIVEFGNENWDPMFRGGSIPDSAAMAEAANRGFELIRATVPSSVPLHLVVNGIFGNPQFADAVLPAVPQADAVDIAPYFFHKMNSSDSQTTALAAMFDNSDEDSLVPQTQTVASRSKKDVDVYEINLETTGGDALAVQRNPLVAGMVSGTALAKRLINGLRLGLRRQVAWDLSSYDDQISPSLGNVYLWGIARDVANVGDLRPTGLALEMLNDAIGGDYYPINVSGSGASGLSAAAFLSSSGWSAVVASSNSIDTQVTITFPAGGTAPTHAYVLSAPTITSDNETGVTVQIKPTAFIGGTNITVPAYGLVELK